MTQCAYVDPSSAPCLFDDKGHRPYQGQNRKDHSPSITTVSGMIDDGKASAFGFAGAEIAAVTAVHDGWGKLVAETTCSRRPQGSARSMPSMLVDQGRAPAPLGHQSCAGHALPSHGRPVVGR